MSLIFLALGGLAFSQSISATNSHTTPCADCTPTGWSDTGGTPDVSRWPWFLHHCEIYWR